MLSCHDTPVEGEAPSSIQRIFNFADLFCCCCEFTVRPKYRLSSTSFCNGNSIIIIYILQTWLRFVRLSRYRPRIFKRLR